MWSINYSYLFKLRYLHDYFVDSKAKDLKLVPTKETLRSLKNAKMLLREIPFGITVLYRADDDEVTPFVPYSNDLRLTFYLVSTDTARFLTVTDLDVSPTNKFESGNVLFFQNSAGSVSTDPDNPEEISHSLLKGVKGSLFTYDFGISGSPSDVLLRVRNSNNELVSVGLDGSGNPLPTTVQLTLDDGGYRQSIDLRDNSAGKYRFTIRNLADDTTLLEEEFYISDELSGKDLLGITEINYDLSDGNLYGDTEEYQLNFNRKETFWTYYVVNKSGNTVFGTDDIFINDSGSGSYPPRTFVRDGNEPHDTIKVNGHDTVIFRSDDVIPFFEEPKLSIQLVRNPGNQTLISSMPNPLHAGITKDNGGNPESEIYVFI